jgi:hypothetical protein
MTITRVGSDSDKRSSGSLQLLLPSVADGDGMVIVAACSDARTLSTPTGTVNTPELRAGYPKQGGTNARAYMWRVKLMAADSGQTLLIAPDASNKISGWIWIGHSSVGLDLDFIDDEDYESKAASDVNYNAPASLSTVAGDWALVSYGTRGTDPQNALFSTPAGLTKLQEEYNTGTGATGIALYDSNGSIGGASTTFGPKAATGLNSGAGFGVTILVKEQTAASSAPELIRVIPIVAATSGGGGGPSPLLVPDAGAWFGVCHNFETLTQYETRVGRLVENQEFHQWTDVFPTAAEQALTDVGGRITLFNWKMGVGWAAVASGVQDAVINACADRFIAWGKRCLLVPGHEPENDVPASGTPANYRAAYRRVVELFRARGATNVIFVWKVMGGQFNPLGTAAYAPGALGGPGDSVWPGDDVVDWVMYDPYNGYGCTNTTWRTFGEIADPSVIGNFSMYDHSATNWPGKPLGIAETGTNEHDALQPTKAQWFTDMLTSLKNDLPRIRGMWYFHAGPPQFCERYIHTSPEAQAAMAAAGADPYFNPTRPTF